jgi:hypothetical protein
MRVADWERMSWHARQKWLKRNRPVQDVPEVVQDPVRDPVQVKPKPVRVRIVKRLQDEALQRCGLCGAWMFHECATDHGRRYEP